MQKKNSGEGRRRNRKKKTRGTKGQGWADGKEMGSEGEEMEAYYEDDPIMD